MEEHPSILIREHSFSYQSKGYGMEMPKKVCPLSYVTLVNISSTIYTFKALSFYMDH